MRGGPVLLREILPLTTGISPRGGGGGREIPHKNALKGAGPFGGAGGGGGGGGAWKFSI